MSALCIFLLAAAVAPATDTTTAGTATATVSVRVTDRGGKPIPGAHVVVNGEPVLGGDTNDAGHIVFTNMKAGWYLLRVERDKFIAFEKEFAVDAQGGWISVTAAVSPLSSLTVRPSRTTASARPAVVPASSRSGRTNTVYSRVK
jgi:hypothetical protein